jgi:ergothioneine biosynthesis protein EgtB
MRKFEAPEAPALPQPISVLPALLTAYGAVRRRTQALVAPLSAEDCCVQSMPDASPAKWHLAHTTWFFETFVLSAYEPGFAPFHPEFRVLFNSYYHGVGRQHPRAQRGLLTRPALAEVLAYRADVDARMARLLQGPVATLAGAQLQGLVTLGLQHEQQHQELLVTDIKHLLSCNPLWPVYGVPAVSEASVTLALEGAATTTAVATRSDTLAALRAWVRCEGGLVEIGHDLGASAAANANANANAQGGFAFDNESPRHKVYLPPYELASRPVSNGEFAAFIAAGGYQEPAHWLAEGWDWRRQQSIEHPLYWQRAPGRWQEFTLQHGLRPLQSDQPVVHVSYYEADAFARWAGARLPSEAEWEAAAAATVAAPRPAHQPLPGHWADDDDAANSLHPRAAGPEARSGLAQLFGDVWEWTQSSYAAYPGFQAAAGAVGEYNGKFMVNQYVLRGGSCATPAGHVRATYRNFFPASARWQFSGLRLARSC